MAGFFAAMNDFNTSEKKHTASLLIGDRQIKLPGSSFLVGRAAINDLVLEDESVSAHHAVIKNEGSCFVVLDLNSTNGTFINGEKVTSEKLTENDQVLFGSVEGIFLIPANAATYESKAADSKLDQSSSIAFTWWPQNRIISGIAAVFFGLLFIFNAAVNPFGALFLILFFYLPMTGLRYLKFKFFRKQAASSSAPSAKGSFGWRPVAVGTVLCSFAALMLVGMAAQSTNNEMAEVSAYRQAKEAALSEHSSVGNNVAYAASTALNVYNGDVVTPIIQGLDHVATSHKLEKDIVAAHTYEQQLASMRQDDGGIIAMAVFILLIPMFYGLRRLIRWIKDKPTALAAICLFTLLSPFANAQKPGGIILDNGWASPMHGGSTSMKELGSLLSVFAHPSPNLAAAPDIEIYRGVTYLMSLAEAKAKLNLTSNIVPKNKVITAGFPKDSLFHHCFDGIFEGAYNKLYLVTDKADQVVAVQLVSESPRRDQAEPVFHAPDWSMFNFINNRRKATTKLWVNHDVYFLKAGLWRQYKASSTINQPTGNETIVRIDSVLMDPALSRSGYRTQDWKFLETSRLYLPKPLMELILHYIGVTGAR